MRGTEPLPPPRATTTTGAPIRSGICASRFASVSADNLGRRALGAAPPPSLWLHGLGINPSLKGAKIFRLQAAGACLSGTLERGQHLRKNLGQILGDQPGLTDADIDRVVAGWRSAPSEIAAASYGGRLGHPMVFSAALFEPLAQLTGDKAAWKLVDARLESVLRVDMGREYPGDVNTPEDYERVRSA